MNETRLKEAFKLVKDFLKENPQEPVSKNDLRCVVEVFEKAIFSGDAELDEVLKGLK